MEEKPNNLYTIFVWTGLEKKTEVETFAEMKKKCKLFVQKGKKHKSYMNY